MMKIFRTSYYLFKPQLRHRSSQFSPLKLSQNFGNSISIANSMPGSKFLYYKKNWFSTSKASIEEIKKLRKETSAPISDCKKALQQSSLNHESAIRWLKQKGIISAANRVNNETREGVISGKVSQDRMHAVLVQVNCESDFVSRNELFLEFVSGLSDRFLQLQNQICANKNIQIYLERMRPVGIFPQDKQVDTIMEELQILMARLKQNIKINRVNLLHSQLNLFGIYVHQQIINGVGQQAALVQIAVNNPNMLDNENNQVNQQTNSQIQSQEQELITQFADNLATQVLGSPPKYLSYEQVPIQILEQEAEKVREEMKQALQRAPEDRHQEIIAGKLNSNFYKNNVLYSMDYILSNDGISVGDYWNQMQGRLNREFNIIKTMHWECK